MSRIQLTATVTVWMSVGITFVGCADVPPSSQSPQLSTRNEDRVSEISAPAVKPSPIYVKCRATLTAFEKDYPWFDDSRFGHDDGVAPMASLVLAEPALYDGRVLGILFKYAADATIPSPPNQADIGSQFTFQIPEDFLSGEYTSIDNATVRHFRKVEP